MRIDVFLAENGFARSRSEAKALIDEGAVTVDGKVITKASFDVAGKESSVILDRSYKKYVSRGGYKLDGALCAFGIDVAGRLAIDVGASSGGFTDCLLQRGVRHVLAVDAGQGQLDASLRADTRVSVYENYNARYLDPSDFPYRPSFACMDVSFISATLILEALYRILDDTADFVCLVKPQFEVGREGLGKGGIVKDEKRRLAALERVIAFGVAIGFTHKSAITSPIKGGDGNIEYLVHFRKE